MSALQLSTLGRLQGQLGFVRTANIDRITKDELTRDLQLGISQLQSVAAKQLYTPHGRTVQPVVSQSISIEL
ncbi:hypothetical protein FACS1894217_10130 [Clostridia bacterium]|nr:hypothetical protein FACS1894217_10130 [Clostridia bacterium]